MQIDDLEVFHIFIVESRQYNEKSRIMSVLVCFHAHPDDEVMLTAGVMMKAKRDGHRVVLVTATDGACGEYPPGILAEGETLADRRTKELEAAAKIIGIDRLVWLGYRDSGMMGTPDNENPSCFWQADIQEAASRLEAILKEESADVLTIYDDHGGYGHPDHIQVHRVGVLAGELVGIKAIYEATINRDHFLEMMKAASEIAEFADVASEFLDRLEEFDMGQPESMLTTAVDVSEFAQAKRDAFFAHESQVAPDSWVRKIPEDYFKVAFAKEYFTLRGASTGIRSDDLFDFPWNET